MSSEQEQRETLEALFSSQRLGVLSTLRDGRPHATLVAFASTDDLREIVFATTRVTRKFYNLSKNPEVALLVDSRTNAPADIREAVAVTANGIAGEVRPEEAGRLKALYLDKHPYLKEFLRSPSCAVVRISVRSYTIVRRFQTVTELHFRE